MGVSLQHFHPAGPLAIDAVAAVSPVLILICCAIAGVATVYLLPGRREPAVGKIAGVTLAAIGLIFAAVLPSYLNSASDRNEPSPVYFWIFSAVAVASAVRVVTHARPVYSALYFVLTVFASAGLFVLMEAEFMAAALILIYAGAILVTYVFVIMLASQATGDGSEGAVTTQMAWHDAHSREPAAAAAVGFALMGVLLLVVLNKSEGLVEPAGPLPMSATDSAVTGQTEELGMFLFRHQSVQLELAGVILLASMVGAIVISRKQVFMSSSPSPRTEMKPDVLVGPATPVDDNPHSIPVYGTESRRAKAY